MTHPPQYERLLQRSRDVSFAMNSDALTGSLLRSLAASKPRGAFLELGTGCGLGTSWMLDGMDAESALLSIDEDAATQSIAREELGHDRRLTLQLTDAGAFLEQCQERFDLIYADALPGKFTHLDEALALLKPGGIYLVDDLLPQANWPAGHDLTVRAYKERLNTLAGFAVTMLGWSTGLMLCVRTTVPPPADA